MKLRNLVIAFFGLSLAGISCASAQCVMLYETAAGQVEHAAIKSESVAALAENQPFVLPANAPANVKSIACVRASLAAERNDYKVLLAGYPLNIIANGRIGVLEVVDGQLRFRMLKGKLEPSESKQVQSGLDAAQVSYGRHTEPTPDKSSKRRPKLLRGLGAA